MWAGWPGGIGKEDARHHSEVDNERVQHTIDELDDERMQDTVNKARRCVSEWSNR